MPPCTVKLLQTTRLPNCHSGRFTGCKKCCSKGKVVLAGTGIRIKAFRRSSATLRMASRQQSSMWRMTRHVSSVSGHRLERSFLNFFRLRSGMPCQLCASAGPWLRGFVSSLNSPVVVAPPWTLTASLAFLVRGPSRSSTSFLAAPTRVWSSQPSTSSALWVLLLRACFSFLAASFPAPAMLVTWFLPRVLAPTLLDLCSFLLVACSSVCTLPPWICG